MNRYPLDADIVAEQIFNYYGGMPQRQKAIEELLECATRLIKDHNESYPPPTVIDKLSWNDMTVSEIADATIMLRQMRLYYGVEAVDEAIERKLKRAMNRIEEGRIK